MICLSHSEILTKFRPISEAAHSWSYDKGNWWYPENYSGRYAAATTNLNPNPNNKPNFNPKPLTLSIFKTFTLTLTLLTRTLNLNFLCTNNLPFATENVQTANYISLFKMSVISYVLNSDSDVLIIYAAYTCSSVSDSECVESTASPLAARSRFLIDACRLVPEELVFSVSHITGHRSSGI